MKSFKFQSFYTQNGAVSDVCRGNVHVKMFALFMRFWQAVHKQRRITHVFKLCMNVCTFCNASDYCFLSLQQKTRQAWSFFFYKISCTRHYKSGTYILERQLSFSPPPPSSFLSLLISHSLSSVMFLK